MKVIGVIPARWQATRFAGKILADIAGKPMIQHVWERARESQRLDDILVACDDQKVFNAVKAFGAQVVMTSANHVSGSDRVAEAVKDLEADIVLNIQGDEPLLKAAVIDALIEALPLDGNAQMATVIKKIVRREEISNPNVVKVVIDNDGHAIYFSRASIPFIVMKKDQVANWEGRYYKHLGLYAYRKDFLLRYIQMPESKLESIERLEQLRVLEAGYKIKTVVTDYESVGVDAPEDLVRVKEIMSGQNN